MCALGTTGRGLVEMPARGLGGGSFFGQAVKRTGAMITIASNPMRLGVPFSLFTLISSDCFVRALHVPG